MNYEVGDQPKEHYTYLVQLLMRAYRDGRLPNVKNIIVEPQYGYVASIEYHSGERRIVYGHDPGINPGAAEELASDKGYTKFILRENDIQCADGAEFLLPWWADTLRQSDRQQHNEIIDTSAALDYINQSLGFPVFVKPSRGFQGIGVAKVENESELLSLLTSYDSERVKVAIIEECLTMPDYRILVFGDEVVNAYERKTLSIVGDGKNTIHQLINLHHEVLRDAGRDIHLMRQMPLIEARLSKMSLSLTDVIVEGRAVQLLDISNLSAGGTAVDISETIHQRWKDLAVAIAKIFNLRVCGVDLACSDITSDDGEYAVIEVNATPGAKQFMASGQAQRDKIERLLLSLFHTP